MRREVDARSASNRSIPLRVQILPGESLDSWVEATATRSGVSPTTMARALGLNVSTRRVAALLTDQSARRLAAVEEAVGLPAGRLRQSIHDPAAVDTVSTEALASSIQKPPGDAAGGWGGWARPLSWNGSRFCGPCLADTRGRWLLSWRSAWSFACPRHQVLLHDTCPGCGGHLRMLLPGGRQPVRPARCPRRTTGPCGSDLTSAPTQGASPAVLTAQEWITAVHHTAGTHDEGASQHTSGRGERERARGILTDLPILAFWLLRHASDEDVERLGPAITASWRAHQQRLADPSSKARYRPTDAALTALVVVDAHTILGHDDTAAIAAIADRLHRHARPRRQRLPPPGVEFAHWKDGLHSDFPRRLLRAADPHLSALDRLRHRSPTPSARRCTVGGPDRLAMLPQLMWPDWFARLLPVAGQRADPARAVLSGCLLLPGVPTRAPRTVFTLLNPHLTSGSLSTVMKTLDAGQRTAVLTVLCQLTDYLDQHGSPIDYQRRRTLAEAATLSWAQWTALSLGADAHPGDTSGAGRHLHARRHLYQLLTGADLTDPAHALAWTSPGDRSAYLSFTETLTTPLRAALHEHAARTLHELGIGEPLTWSPPASCSDGVALPGIDTKALDLDTITDIVINQERPLRDAARALGVHVEHVRLGMELIDRSPRIWGKNTTPTAWHTRERAAALFTRDYFDHEYLAAGRTMRELEQQTGIGRRLIAQFARAQGLTLASVRQPAAIDQAWLRQQYLTRTRSTADIAADLGVTEMTVNRAIHRFNIPMRAPGVSSHPEMIKRLGPRMPADIRAAAEHTRHGWQRLHRFDIAMPFPDLGRAAAHLGIVPRTLVVQFQQLETALSAQLFHRATFNHPQSLTPRGRSLLRDLRKPHVAAAMHRALVTLTPPPSPDLLQQAHAASHVRARPRPATYDDQTIRPQRMTRPLRLVLQTLLDSPPTGLYGLAIATRASVNDGTLCPMLARLHRDGWITSTSESDDVWTARCPPGHGSPRRRYHQLTPQGRQAAERELNRPRRKKAQTP